MRGGTTVVGREAELTHMAERVTDLLDGTGRAILIEGEPGIGKSTLARAVIAVAAHHGCQIYKASSDELGQELPLQPLLDALRARESAGEPRLNTIMRLLQGDLPSGGDPTIAASEQMLTLITELCSAAPTMLIVDDIHWAD